MCVVPLKKIEHGVYGDLIIIYPKPYSIYLRETISFQSRRSTASGEAAGRYWPPSRSGVRLSLGLWTRALGRPLGYLIFSLMALIRDPIY